MHTLPEYKIQNREQDKNRKHIRNFKSGNEQLFLDSDLWALILVPLIFHPERNDSIELLEVA